MQSASAVTISVLQGPSVLAPFPAVMTEFPAPGGPSRTAADVARALESFLNPEFLSRVALPLEDGAFETVVGALANALQDAPGSHGLPVRATRGVNGRCRVLLGYHDTGAAVVALQASLQVTAALFRQLAGGAADARVLAATLDQAVAEIRQRQPDARTRSLLRIARQRGIPAYPAAPGSRVWVYGQGAAAVQFFEAASHRDAFIGARLARSKLHSNRLVTRLGLPGVRHQPAATAAEARKIAAGMGFPVVVKPAEGGKGSGVSAGLASEAEVEAAFRIAEQASPGKVLVEAHIAGDDHRIAVFGGRFAWAVRRSPPRVTGDGAQTVRELIAAENARRLAAPNPDLAGTPIVVEPGTEALLATQGLALDARPAAGVSVALGRIANISRGGTLVDCSAAVHPDNKAMAEAIARSFHLDAAGIDFMTPDISRSWREVPCGVLELNSTPGFSSDGRAEFILATKFPMGADGRLPSVLLVGAGAPALAAVTAAITATGRRAGWTDGESTGVGTELRFTQAMPLPERVIALVLDPCCEALVIAATAAEISNHGLPLDRFDVALVSADAGLSRAASSLLTDCCVTVRHDLPAEAIATAGWPDIAAVLERRGAGARP
ncbi:MAG: hypothetical protein JNK40_03135 [Chromatiales bacterium]|nr:hypothetical protein [Chromatiales bacterium]